MLGVPNEINYGRVMGGHIEMLLQSMRVRYTVEAFNEKEVIYNIDRRGLSMGYPKLVDAHVAYWYGMTKTLISAQWSLWEEQENVSEDKIRIKISKKIDKFC